MKTYTYHVSGTHCASCKILLEDILGEEQGIQRVSVNLKNETVEIDTDRPEEINELASLLTQRIEKNRYTLSTKKHTQVKQIDIEKSNSIWQALPIGLGFLVLFFLLQKSGILNLGIGGQTTPLTSFIIGLIASVSSCLAIVGGLILSLSAKISQDNVSDTKTFILFHSGRIIGFALLGGVLGLIGKTLGVSFIFSAILGLIASLVMIFLGLNLVGVFAKNNITLPSSLFSYFKKIEHATLTPIVIGIGTFFLPCGFTQSMQIAALSSGTFVSGTLIMLAFALGTLPVLLVLSFGSASFAQSKHAPLFFKSAGIVVIGLGLFAFIAGLAGLGIINPLFSI